MINKYHVFFDFISERFGNVSSEKRINTKGYLHVATRERHVSWKAFERNAIFSNKKISLQNFVLITTENCNCLQTYTKFSAHPLNADVQTLH